MNETLRVVVDFRQAIQKTRIQFSNRLSAIDRGADSGDGAFYERYRAYLETIEKELDQDIADLAATEPIIELMTRVKGVGPMLAAKVVSQIDITRAQSVSALWRYAGYGVVNDYAVKVEYADENGDRQTQLLGVCDTPIDARELMMRTLDISGSTGGVGLEDTEAHLIYMGDLGARIWIEVDGKREKPVKGEKLHYNRTLKTACYLVASSFLKCSSPYRRLYDNSRERYEQTKPEWTKLHRHHAAMGYMTKIWLSHLWETWRILEGLSVRDAYVHAYLGHESRYTPQEFGWPSVR